MTMRGNWLMSTSISRCPRCWSVRCSSPGGSTVRSMVACASGGAADHPGGAQGAFIPASEIVEDLERADRDLDRQLRERYDAFMREHGVPAAGSVLPGAEGRRRGGTMP